MFQPAPTLTIANARVILDAGLRAIAQGQGQFDLSGLETVDSAAVATLLAWKRAARSKGVQLVFTDVPDSLQSMGELYDVTQLLFLAKDHSRSDLPHH